MKHTYRQNPDVLQRSLDRDGVIYDEVNDTVHQLNETAFLIWKVCVHASTEEEILERLLNRYQVDAAKAGDDVSRVVSVLMESNLLISKSGEE